MLGVFEALGFELSRVLAGGNVEVTFPIARTEPYEARLAERDHVAVTASLRGFFEPDAVAVVGASRRRGTIGGELFRNIIEADFEGAAYPVNRKGEPVAGVRGYGSTKQVPEPVDLAVIAVPAAAVMGAVEDALEAGVRTLLVVFSRVRRGGSEGRERQDALLALVRAHGARLIGPNCLGIAVPGRGLNATFGARSAPRGNIGFSAQSGALGIAFLEAAAIRGLGLSAFVSIGNKADVSTNDLLEWWEDDSETEAILLYVESFGNPRRFASLGRRVAREKPIVALKSGTTASGQAAASSHTAALAGSDAAADALFRQAGVTRAESLEELIDVAALFSRKPRLADRSVAILTNAGGLGILCADACDAAGLELPALADDTVSRLREVLPAEASTSNPSTCSARRRAGIRGSAHPSVGRPPCLRSPCAVCPDRQRVRRRRCRCDRTRRRRSVPGQAGARGRHVCRRHPRPASDVTPRGELRLPGVRRSRARPRRRARSLARRPQGRTRADARRMSGTCAASRRPSSGTRGRRPGSLRTRRAHCSRPTGCPCVETLAPTPEAAVAAAVELGFPVAVKTSTPGAHKTETKGVYLGLADEAAVRGAAESIGTELVVQPMIVGGAELLAGVVQDPVLVLSSPSAQGVCSPSSSARPPSELPR